MSRPELFFNGEPATYEYIQNRMRCSGATVTDRIKAYGRNLKTEHFARKPRVKEFNYAAFDNDGLVYRPPEGKGSGKFDTYQLKPIVLPPTMTEEDMKPYRNLANRVLTEAFSDLIPTRPRTQSSRKTEQAKVKLTVSGAYRFLSGESGTDRLGLWCSLAKQPVWKVKAQVRDKVKIVRKMRSLLESTGRGRKAKNRVEVVA